MTHATTGRATVSRLLIGTALAFGLSACEDGEMPAFLQASSETVEVTRADSSTRTVERDVEAPDVFETTDKGLWDGRPSLGGVWVAHADAMEPERVIIRNQSNSKFVVGVLYRPERQQPGPKFQVSSDAADALGMLAGQPAELNVTALRKQEVSEAPTLAAATPATTGTPKVAAAPKVEATTLDPIKAAAAAIDKADPTPKPTVKPTTKTSVATLASATGAATAPVAATPKAPAKSSGLSKPFIQIGIFSVQTNANNTSEAMRQAGMVPTVKQGKMKDKDFWRVIVGPANTSSERAALLKKIKGLGFTDAYYVTN